MFQSQLPAPFPLPGDAPLTWQRRYSTATLDNPPSPLGPGWTTRYFATLTRSKQSNEYQFLTPEGATEVFSDPSGAVERGGIVRNLGSFSELSKRGSHYVVTRWDVDTGDIERFVFQEGKRGVPWALARIEDVTGQGLELLYDRRGRLKAIRQRLEKRTVVLDYSPDDRIVSLALLLPDKRQRILVRYEYDEKGRLAAAIDARDHRDAYEYDGQDRLVREILKGGAIFLFTYDGRGRCVKSTREDGFDLKTLRYLDNLGWTEVTDSLGNTTRYQWLPTGQIVTEINPLGAKRTTQYDRYGRIVAEIDPLGALTRYDYDDQGNRCKIIDPLGNEWSLTYNHAHLPLTLTDPKGGVWKRFYNARNQIVATENPLGGRLELRYDQQGNIIRITDQNGATQTQVYSPRGDLLERTDWQGKSVRYRRDEFGRVIERIGPLGDPTRFRYDATGNLVEIEFSDGTRVTATYDENGNLASFTDSNGHTTRYRYGACGRFLHKIDALGRKVEYHWGTEFLQLERIVNERGETFSFKYDAAGRVIEEEDFDGTLTVYRYDAADNCIAIRRGDEELQDEITYEYDAAGNLVREVFPDGSSVEYEHDPVGDIVSARNADCHIRLVRDPLGRVIKEFQGDFVLEFTYDAVDNLTRTRTSLGHVVDYAFDANGQLSRVTTASGRTILLERNARGEEIGRRLPGGAMLRQQFDVVGRLIRQRVDLLPGPAGAAAGAASRPGAGGAPVIWREYRYGRTNALLSVTDGIWGRTDFTYDPVERLVSAFRDHGEDERFEYDPAGNVTSIESSRSGVTRLDYGAGNRLLSRGDTRYEYDHRGRLITKVEHAGSGQERVWRYSWDANDQLREVIRPDGSIWKYAYDPFGRRISKSGPDGTTRYVWERDVVVHEVDERGAARSTWIYEQDSFTPLAKIEGRAFYSVIPDHGGTPRELIDEQGRVVWSVALRSWGGATDGGRGSVDCPIRFQGQWFDSESGLHYNYYRYYDPETGRYICKDPIGLYGGHNLYLYARNPINWFDPLGLGKCSKELRRRRQAGIRKMWKREAQRIREGRPSRKWTREQKDDILAGNVPKSAVDGKPIEGAHIKPVKDYPELADDPDNIVPKSFTEHRKKDSGEHSKNPKNWDIGPNTTP